MRLWSMLASLVVVGVMVSGALAQEGKESKKGDGKQRGRHMMSFKDMVGSDDGKLTEELFVKARTKNVPEAKKEQATKATQGMWKRLAGDKKELTKDEYEAALKKMMDQWKRKGDKKGDRPDHQSR